jgi:RNA polymerase sigma-70 factor (ECF subfamily)
MQHSEAMSLPAARWNEARLEDNAIRQLLLDYYDREGLPLWRYVAFLGVPADNCEDIVQECFLRLYEHLLGGGDRTNLRAWLFRVAHNLSRNTQTVSLVRKTRSFAALHEKAEARALEATAEEHVLRREREANLQKQISALSDAQRDCLLLRTQGLKYREIADVLQISISAVGENILRGLEQLKKAL